jgi:hypothetical protein
MNFYIYVDVKKYAQNKKRIDDFLEIKEHWKFPLADHRIEVRPQRKSAVEIVLLASKISDFED